MCHIIIVSWFYMSLSLGQTLGLKPRTNGYKDTSAIGFKFLKQHISASSLYSQVCLGSEWIEAHAWSKAVSWLDLFLLQFTKPQDLYTQQDPLVLDTSAGSTGKAVGMVPCVKI